MVGSLAEGLRFPRGITDGSSLCPRVPHKVDNRLELLDARANYLIEQGPTYQRTVT